MFDLTASPWLPVALLVAVTIVSRLRCCSWFAPAAFTGLVWIFFITASLLASDYAVPSRGVWMLVILVVAIQSGALLAHELRSSDEQASLSSRPDVNPLVERCQTYSLICTLVALGGCCYFLLMSLEEFNLPFTPIGILEVGARWTLLRYDDAVEPWSVRLLVTWFHPAALLGGILFFCGRRRIQRWLAAFTLLPAVLYGMLTGARAAILIGMTCWISGYMSALVVYTSERLAMFTRARLVALAALVICVFGMFVGIDIVRDTGWIHDVMVDVRGQKLSNYMFGSPAAFATWYGNSEISGPFWGARTFAGEFDLLHIKARTLGTYSEKSNVVGTEDTNVYTIFRSFIEDFGLFGAVLAVACIGGASGWIYCVRQLRPLGSILVLSIFYALVLFSPLYSLFSFNGPTLAWLVAAVLFSAAKRASSQTSPFLNLRHAPTP